MKDSLKALYQAGASGLLIESRPDSDRFGLRVFRAHTAELDGGRLFREIVAHEADIAIVRIPAGTEASAQLQRLGRYGMHPIHADTLVYYRASLADRDQLPLRNDDLVFTEATAGDASQLGELVAGTFDGYVSHYHANPRLDRAQILAGYAEWAAGYLGGHNAQQLAWVARRQGKIVAFACCRHDEQGDECEGVLYGVHPDHSGGGIYGDLMRYTQAQYRARGYRSMIVSTQIWNLAVQKVWSREGFVLDRAYDTFHVNAMLSAGDARVERELVFSPEQVAQFAAVTGDTNAVHLDDDAARSAGFDSRISHGMLAGGELSRIFGTEVPGPGTLFLRADMVFLKPIYPGRSYTLRIRYPSEVSASGHIATVTTIRDLAGNLCLLCYSDLMKKN